MRSPLARASPLWWASARAPAGTNSGQAVGEAQQACRAFESVEGTNEGAAIIGDVKSPAYLNTVGGALVTARRAGHADSRFGTLATDLSNYVGDVAAIQSAIRNGQLPGLAASEADVNRVRTVCNAIGNGRY